MWRATCFAVFVFFAIVDDEEERIKLFMKQELFPLSRDMMRERRPSEIFGRYQNENEEHFVRVLRVFGWLQGHVVFNLGTLIAQLFLNGA